ncbi:unnamed protein product [Rotaria socialis]|uniref:sn-1-specific diacylglycerol lipase ABHD11 n=1 Tax=Rotaria socialis TaxID=392032 RepID=A0A818CTY2_9BILA|nr:unnamed protein product [Rotaria socialis]CAF3435311.1 unnamed protein product [Rotaria socialis]CAF4267256.1 unnamed protein product [Rotaria socialis]CAF4540169.1 unnamed protein product [Rotaria socialis]
MNQYLKIGSGLISLNRTILFSFQRFQHVSSAKGVTLFEDVYNPPNEMADPERCLIITHGLFGFRTNWRSLAKAFSERAKIKVVTVDMRNHGDSPYTDSMNYCDMASDLIRTIEKHQMPKTILMGHSMGGKAAMIVALEKPKLLRKLIVVDIAPTISASIGEIPSYTRILLDNIHRIQSETDIVAARRAMDAILQKSSESLQKTKSLRDFLLMLIAYDEPSGRFIWRANLEVLEEHMNDIMHFPTEYDNTSVDVDTLFIAGGKSPYINDESLPKIRSLFPLYRLIRIPNAGHWVHSERPHDFLNCVLPELEIK